MRLVPRILFLLALLAPLGASAQQPLFVGEPVSEHSALLSQAQRAALAGAFHAYELFALDAEAVTAHLRDAGGPFTIRLGAAHEWHLALEPHDLRAPGHVLRLAGADGEEMVAPSAPSTYKGVINGTGRVRASVRPDGLIANVQDIEEMFLEPLWQVAGGAPDGVHVLYRLADVRAAADARCGVAAMERMMAPENDDAMRGGNPCRLARIAIAADASMVAFLGSAAAVENRINDILNWVDGKYQEPAINIAYQLVATFISTSMASDPWSASQDAVTLLNSFVSWGNGGGFGAGTPYAVATLWTRRDIQANGSSGTVGLAYVGVVCTNSRYNLCEHYTTSMAAPSVVQAHELGHNWNAQHTTTTGNWIMAPTASTANVNWDDASIASIVAHKNTRTCLVASCLLAPVADFAASATTSCDGTVAFTDLSTNSPSAWLWSFGDGATSTLQNPVHTYAANGTYTVTLTATNATGSDAEVKSAYITVDLLPVPQAVGAVVCAPGGTVSLTATGPGNLLWYEQPSGGEPVASGPVFEAEVSATTTWYVASSTEGPIVSAGPASNAFGTGGNFNSNANWGLHFDVLAPATLVSVKVYASGAGNRTIQVLNSAGAVVESRTASIPNGESRVQLGMDLQPGTQYLIKVAATPVNLYRNNSGAAFPYTAPGLVSITGTNATGAAATENYYFFYDWEVRATGCSSARVPVTAVVEPCAGVQESALAEIGLVPNPTDGRLLLSWDAAMRTAAVEARDAFGRLVLRQRLPSGAATTELLLDEAPGAYWLLLRDEAGAVLGRARAIVSR